MWCANEGREQMPLGDRQERCWRQNTDARGGEEDVCIKVTGGVLRFDSCLRIRWGKWSSTATPELEVPIPGTMQHFSSKEQETVKVFLSLHCMVEAARCIRGMKGWHVPHLTTHGAATKERYGPCCHQVMLWACFALCFLSGERDFSHISLIVTTCAISPNAICGLNLIKPL